MPFIDYMAREINCKVVYYGPGLSGKTTNMQYIYNRVDPASRGKMISLATETERTLFFDFLPQSLGEIRGFKVRLHLYTVPGPVFYDTSRKLILKGADGIIFVADSQEARLEANSESFENLTVNLEEHQFSLDTVPLVLQYNKRDLPEISPIEQLERDLNPAGRPSFEASAHAGKGVFDTLKGCTKLILEALKQPQKPPPKGGGGAG